MSQDGTWVEPEPSNCQARARGIDVQCLKDDKNHIFGETPEERLHEGVWREHPVSWGATADADAVWGPIPKTECD